MTTSTGAKGVTTGGFWPEGDTPDYEEPGAIRFPGVDVAGNLAIRGPVATDEGGRREDFGTPLGSGWIESAGGGLVEVANSLLVVSTALSPIAGDISYVSRRVDFLPILVHALLGESGTVPFNLAGVSGSSMEAFFGLYAIDEVANPNMNPDHPSAQAEFVEWCIKASGGNNVATMRTRAHAGAGGSQESDGVTVINRNSPGWRSIGLDGENAVFRDNASQFQALPPVTTRAVHSGHVPGLYTSTFLSIGIRSGATPGSSRGTFAVDTLFIKNFNRLVVNTGF